MRKPTACMPCHRMKVACDGKRPCHRCIARDRVALCTSQESSAAERKDADSSALQVQSTIQSSLSHARLPSTPAEEDSHDGDATGTDPNSNVAFVTTRTSTDGTTIIDSETGEIVFVGRHASMLYFRSLLSDLQQASIPMDATLSAFLLTNKSTLHPFVTLWRPGFDLADIFEALPENRLCLKYFEDYREASRYYLPVCIDFVDFEPRMCFILQQRSEVGVNTAIDQSFRNESVSRNAWCGLWFAVLAAGCQWSESGESEQDVTIKVFVACAFECLRRAQIYACSSLEILQALHLLEAVVCNAGNPGLAWNLLVSTWRKAYGIGLSNSGSALGPLADSLWHSMMELDAATSYAYGRVPLVALTCKDRIRRSTDFDQLARPLNSPKEAGKRLHCLRMAFQNEDWPDLNPNARLECLDRYLSKVELLDSLVSNSPTTTANEIKGVEIFNIIASQFKGDLNRHVHVTENSDSTRKMHSYEEAKKHYHQVLLSFNQFVRFEKSSRLSWTIKQSVTSSTMLLAALDHASCSSKYKTIVQTTLSAFEGVPVQTEEPTIESGRNTSALRSMEHALKITRALYQDK